MTRVQARIRYYNRGFWIHPDLLGWRHTFQRDGMDVEVQLPATPDEFTAKPHETELQPVPSFVPVATVTGPDWTTPPCP